MQDFKQIERSTLKTDEAAEYIGISKDLLYKLCRENQVPHFKINSKLLFKKKYIDEWIEAKMAESEEG